MEFLGLVILIALAFPIIAIIALIMALGARDRLRGTFRFTWTDDDGKIVTAEEKITVRT